MASLGELNDVALTDGMSARVYPGIPPILFISFACKNHVVGIVSRSRTSSFIRHRRKPYAITDTSCILPIHKEGSTALRRGWADRSLSSGNFNSSLKSALFL